MDISHTWVNEVRGVMGDFKHIMQGKLDLKVFPFNDSNLFVSKSLDSLRGKYLSFRRIMIELT